MRTPTYSTVIEHVARIGSRIADATVCRLYRIVGRWYLTPMLLYDWKYSRYDHINERVIEFEFALRWLSKICPFNVLDIGPGSSSWPHIMSNCGFRVTAIDKISGYSRRLYFNRHYYIVKDDITQPKITGPFDLVTCISVLEHIPDHKKAIEGMFKLIKPGGYIILTFPYNEKRYVENAYALPEAGYGKIARYVCQVFSRKEIDAWLDSTGGTLVDQEYYKIFTGALWTFGKRIYPPSKVANGQNSDLTCLILQRPAQNQ
jgi:2-polyprenyl-3-methyl-5-hydroxy-6-metoxy-1,4-benzoquinol methylase